MNLRGINARCSIGLLPLPCHAKENAMDGKELKKVLASLGIASLVAAVGAMTPGHLHAGSG